MITAHIQSEHYKTLLTNGRHTLIADESLENKGLDKGMAPSELLLSALGACTAITLRMYADRKEWPLRDVRVQLELDPKQEAGQTGRNITRTIHLEGDLDESQRQRLMEIAEKCPVHLLLTGQIGITTTENVT